LREKYENITNLLEAAKQKNDENEILVLEGKLEKVIDDINKVSLSLSLDTDDARFIWKMKGWVNGGLEALTDKKLNFTDRDYLKSDTFNSMEVPYQYGERVFNMFIKLGFEIAMRKNSDGEVVDLSVRKNGLVFNLLQNGRYLFGGFEKPIRIPLLQNYYTSVMPIKNPSGEHAIQICFNEGEIFIASTPTQIAAYDYKEEKGSEKTMYQLFGKENCEKTETYLIGAFRSSPLGYCVIKKL
jgi:hypothetical protein